MADVGDTIFDEIYNSMPGSRVTWRSSGLEADGAIGISAGISVSRVDTGQRGQVDMVSGNLRAKQSAASGLKVGDQIDIKRDSDATWVKARISSMLPVAGVVRIELESEYD
jgi:hypothetical protein